MSVLKSENNKEIMLGCVCSCDNIKFLVEEDENHYCLISYYNSNFYRDHYGAFGVLKRKIIKIWKVITNKDIYYSEILLTKDEYQEFKKFINKL